MPSREEKAFMHQLVRQVQEAASVLQIYDAEHELLQSAKLFCGCASEQLWLNFHDRFKECDEEPPADVIQRFINLLETTTIEIKDTIEKRVASEALFELDAVVAAHYAQP